MTTPVHNHNSAQICLHRLANKFKDLQARLLNRHFVQIQPRLDGIFTLL